MDRCTEELFIYRTLFNLYFAVDKGGGYMQRRKSPNEKHMENMSRFHIHFQVYRFDFEYEQKHN